MGRAPCCEKIGLKQGRWTKEEDEILANYIEAHGEGSWRSLPKKAGLLRCGKSCRLRWINYLRAGLKRGSFSTEEDELIIKLHASLGNRWSLIANELPGRTDNDIKNYWNSHLFRSIDSFDVIQNGNTDAESVKPLKNSQKNNSKKERKKRKVANKVIIPQTSYKHYNETIVESEFSSLSDEALWDSNEDAFNNSECWTLESMKSPSEYSCTTDEPSTSKEEIRTEPRSPDFNSILKEIDDLLNGEIEEKNVEHWTHDNIKMHDDKQNGRVVHKEVGMEEEGFFEDLECIDVSWDMNLWSLHESPKHIISGHCIQDAFDFSSNF